MPLEHKKSKKAFEHNLKAEMHEGKPLKQSLAIAYAVKRRAKKMAEGGNIKAGKQRHENEKGVHPESFSYGNTSSSNAGAAVRSGAYDKGMPKSYAAKMKAGIHQEHKEKLAELKSMPNPKLKGLAHGGEVDPYHHSLHDSEFHGEEEASGYMNHEGSDVHHNEAAEHEDSEMAHEDMVGRIMKKRMLAMGGECYSRGGVVANEDHGHADALPNEFDDLVLDDHLESHYDADNAGDHLGDAAQDHRDEDMVSKIMKSRAKKDRLPRI